jgi:quercetin dioxygenase-like cupin family protein
MTNDSGTKRTDSASRVIKASGMAGARSSPTWPSNSASRSRQTMGRQQARSFTPRSPGKSGGRHAHSAEKILLVLEGTAQLAVGNEWECLCKGSMAVIPAATAHEPVNVGSEPVRFLAIFSSAMVLHTWDVPVEPTRDRMLATPPTEE